MSLSENVNDQEQKRDKFFLVLALIGLCTYLAKVQDQILASPIIPTFEDAFACLLSISANKIETESFVLAIQKINQQGDNQKRKGKGFKSHCTYCDRESHTQHLLGPSWMTSLQYSS